MKQKLKIKKVLQQFQQLQQILYISNNQLVIYRNRVGNVLEVVGSCWKTVKNGSVPTEFTRFPTRISTQKQAIRHGIAVFADLLELLELYPGFMCPKIFVYTYLPTANMLLLPAFALFCPQNFTNPK